MLTAFPPLTPSCEADLLSTRSHSQRQPNAGEMTHDGAELGLQGEHGSSSSSEQHGDLLSVCSQQQQLAS